MEDQGHIPAFFDVGLPPVSGEISELLEPYLRLEDHPLHSFRENVKSVRCPRNINSLLEVNSTQLPLTLKVKRHPATGQLLSYEEAETSSNVETPHNSLSLNRAPGRKTDGLKGCSANLPFWPGGFDEEKKLREATDKLGNLEVDRDEAELFHELFEKDLQKTPPGFQNGFDFSSTIPNKKIADKINEIKKELAANPVNFWDVKKTDVMDYEPSASKLAKQERQVKLLLKELDDDSFNPEDKKQEVSNVTSVLKISKTQSRNNPIIMPWAEEIDVTKPMFDFEQKVPNMAFKYPFELDTFQKQAIAKLEDHENVFVAAHTSAGKTVVAEYAIALSCRHMTRTVYTSPIKALSNQKFRDFKNQFESVGLVTGDVQINPGASCLIMTTEILRSMLYNGSDVIRDLEWVIFDEIHYLNNEERGHVWEEVLIMLPQHISIIMLSATVPNALQFANWVGEIKKKKIYVITTLKRPVPLEHYLYTGSGGKTRNEIFRILSGEGKFEKRGYDEAIEAKRSRQKSHEKQYGPKGGRNFMSEAAEKTTYIGLVSYLKDNDKLPVVIFTFSRKRCDQYAQMLRSTDLCTATQKSEIHSFFMKSIARLKGSDRELPQVLTVQEMLKCGIGVHHSGILPILKEVVEMLFQRGLVKLLFATETFAMGVNMPARTVVFDSTRKHDGMSFRNLNPAEYIQMAGRAGRRGLDTTGTVILLCKQNVPDSRDLQDMMLGKAAKLESQFRLTYSMILNLLRVESLSVEDVMKRSFLEAGSRNQNVDETKKKLVTVRNKVGELEWDSEVEERDPGLIRFYRQAKECITLQDSLVPFMKSHTRGGTLCIGRCVIFQRLPKYTTRFGVILDMHPPRSMCPDRLIILTLTSVVDHMPLNQRGLQVSGCEYANLLVEPPYEILDKIFLRFLYLCHNAICEFEPLLNEFDYFSHDIVEVEFAEILDVTNVILRVDTSIIMNDVRRRQADRFRREKPCPNLDAVLGSLVQMHSRPMEVMLLPPNQFLLPTKDLNLIQEVLRYQDCKADLKHHNVWSRWGDMNTFLSKFREVFCYMRLQDMEEYLDFLLSPRSLRLHEEYESRINVLKKLKYIDDENLVQLKGRVACEMGNQNELMVTEMVLNNVLADAPPEEVAALLSCMVFEVKSAEEPTFQQAIGLKERVETVKKIARNIGEIQRECGMKEPVEQFVEQFKFGLAEVVHEWARGKVSVLAFFDLQ
ncbi:unnamed protein product [Orchesella dallaii]|uniref:Helicase SKI2W n=1 Tax=Orchesella dallaii TaxID=48710 RepID=A0ABP1QMT0_9HEXA